MRQFQLVTSNLKASSVRHERLEGRECFVVPMAMLAEGVHDGSNGPLYYPGDELGKDPGLWNHVPIVVYHPEDGGQMVSARTPEVINARKVGVVLNSRYSMKLRAEAWLFKDRLDAVDPRIRECVENERQMEVSTGLFTDNERNPGTWRGEAYCAIARNYRPDHLALLPDQVGAYSIADGGGLLAVNGVADDDWAILTCNVNPSRSTGSRQAQMLNEYLAASGAEVDGLRSPPLVPAAPAANLAYANPAADPQFPSIPRVGRRVSPPGGGLQRPQMF